MQLWRSGQSQRRHVDVLIAVVGLHFVVGLLLLATGRIRIARLRTDTTLVLLSLAQERLPQVPIASPPSNLKTQDASRDIDRPPSVMEAGA
jgi:hypothetical protein